MKNTEARLWKVAQYLGVATTAALLVGLLVRPSLALLILWSVLIPLVPASLLISPALWRNVCPLSTLSFLTNRSSGDRTQNEGRLATASALGILLLLVMVPARRFLFNTDGRALAITITSVAASAMALGWLFRRKAGFCNGICPVLPVERLYGQHPLIQINNPRCRPCDMCTGTACIDLSPSMSFTKLARSATGARPFLTAPLGMFAAAFPGFVIGYSTTQDGPLQSAWSVLSHVALWMAASYSLAALLIFVLNVNARQSAIVLAATAVGLYYWFTADAITRSFGLPGWATTLIRVVTLGLAFAWLWRAWGANAAEEQRLASRRTARTVIEGEGPGGSGHP